MAELNESNESAIRMPACCCNKEAVSVLTVDCSFPYARREELVLQSLTTTRSRPNKLDKVPRPHALNEKSS